MRSVACKNDNSAYLHFLVMSPDPYFYFISGALLVIISLCSATVRNILMVLGSNIEQANAECCIQE